MDVALPCVTVDAPVSCGASRRVELAHGHLPAVRARRRVPEVDSLLYSVELEPSLSHLRRLTCVHARHAKQATGQDPDGKWRSAGAAAYPAAMNALLGDACRSTLRSHRLHVGSSRPHAADGAEHVVRSRRVQGVFRQSAAVGARGSRGAAHGAVRRGERPAYHRVGRRTSGGAGSARPLLHQQPHVV